MFLLDRAGPVVTITMARGDARNAIPIAGWERLAALAEEVAGSDARAVILQSSDVATFSAGADIAEMGGFASDPALRTQFRTAMRAAIDGVAALPMPVLAAIDGSCFGAAVALALACDLRIAGDGAQFAATPAKLGIAYPRQDVARLVGQVGKGQAARMLYSGEILDAGEAERIGLAELRWEEAAPVARIFADRIAANAPGAIRLLKQTLADPAAPALDAAFDARFGSDEFAEGRAAFQQRRRPDFA
jgi:enoyl-CoA hydratase/carnithine racemase